MEMRSSDKKERKINGDEDNRYEKSPNKKRRIR